MASASLRDEVTCSICLDVYRDPVTLRCGHNFCRVCIACELGTQDRSRVYKCPVCRKRFTSRPELEKNINLCNIAHRFPSTGPEQVETGVFCTYCEFPDPATKTCLQCETSMCDRHLRIHNRSVGHVLISPTTNLENRKCSVHKKILEYYCTEDSACICVSCSLAGDHRGHQVETLDEASEKKKEKLRNVLQKLTSKKEETERRAQSLEERRRDVQDKAAGERERVTALIRDSRRQLEDLEKRLLSEISRQEERVSLSVSDLIRQLEIKKDELSRKMSHIEELCNMTDPLTVLQEQESDRDGSSDSNEEDDEDTERDNNLVHDVGDLDVGLISQTLQKGLSDIISGVKRRFALPEPTVILLDVNTAANNVVISGYLKTASGSDLIQNHPETPERFQYYPQVLSMMRFSSGRHYWEVDASNSNSWRIGMCYPSIERRGRQSHIGNNNKSWCLGRYNTDYTVMYDNKVIQLSHNIPCNRVRVYLDYEAGRLSFSSLCDPIRHLHTFTATFTEPLHAVICVWQGSLKICN